MSLWGNLLRIDRNMNADVFNGKRKETMSGRMGRKLIQGDNGCCKLRMILCKLLSVVDLRHNENHCIKAYQNEENKSDG